MNQVWQRLLSNSRKVSLKLRLTALFVLIFGATFIGFSIFTFKIMARSFEQSFDDALYNYAVDVFDKISLGNEGDLEVATPYFDREKIYPFSLGTGLIQIRHSSGKVVTQIGDFGALDLPFRYDRELILKGEPFHFRTITKIEGLPNQEASSYRMITVPVDNAPEPQLFLQIAVPRTLLEEQLNARKWALEILIPLALLISTFGGYFLSARALKPVREMIERTQGISASDLSTRIPIPFAKDELQDLGQTINAMLERIEKAFLSQERFVADASHQLLTPLTVLRNELEMARRGSVADFESMIQEVSRLTDLVKGLLLLARVDSGKGALTMQQFPLDEVLSECITRVHKIATARKIKLNFNLRFPDDASNELEVEPAKLSTKANARKEFESDFSSPEYLTQAWGEKELITNLLDNLLENAVKYSPDGGIVAVDLILKRQFADIVQRVEIADQGPGVSEKETHLIFERFTRGASAQKTNREGHGLGLAIAQTIARIHDAKLWVEKRAGQGSMFVFEMKKN